MNKPLTPFLLSTCVLPGLGQMKIGKKAKGLFFSLTSLALCILPLVFFLKSFWKLSQQILPHRNQKELLIRLWRNLGMSFFENQTLIIGGISLLAVVWIWNSWDIWKETQS